MAHRETALPPHRRPLEIKIEILTRTAIRRFVRGYRRMDGWMDLASTLYSHFYQSLRNQLPIV